MDISSSPELMEILLDAGAVDLDSDEAQRALYVPIKEDYLESCLDDIPTDMAEDPGENAFGTGATPPFLLRPGRDDLAPADLGEFEKIVRTAADYADSLGIFSIPVATEKAMSVFDCSRMMGDHFPDLKMTYTRNMSDSETKFFARKDDWLDGTSLITSLTYMPNMVDPFLRSARAGNNLLLLDLTIAGATGPASPEALLTQIHAQVLFMMMLAQTVNPGVVCVHGGIPDVLGIGGDLDYSDPGQPLINSAMARLNLWVTGFPSAQSGGSTSIVNDIEAAVFESALSRNTLRTYGVHILRHAMGALGNLTYFSLDKFVMDCEREREVQKALAEDQARLRGASLFSGGRQCGEGNSRNRGKRRPQKRGPHIDKRGHLSEMARNHHRGRAKKDVLSGIGKHCQQRPEKRGTGFGGKGRHAVAGYLYESVRVANGGFAPFSSACRHDRN